MSLTSWNAPPTASLANWIGLLSPPAIIDYTGIRPLGHPAGRAVLFEELRRKPHLWLTNDEASYDEARRCVEKAGNCDAAAEALEAMVGEGSPLRDAEPNLYTDLLTYALAGIAWIHLAEALAPDDWTAGPSEEVDDDLDWLTGLPPEEL